MELWNCYYITAYGAGVFQIRADDESEATDLARSDFSPFKVKFFLEPTTEYWDQLSLEADEEWYKNQQTQ